MEEDTAVSVRGGLFYCTAGMGSLLVSTEFPSSLSSPLRPSTSPGQGVPAQAR